MQHAGLLSAAVMVAVGLSACGGGGATASTTPTTPVSSCAAKYPVTHITASIAAPTTWSACNVYAVDSSISVNSALTIQPGAVVKFATGVPGGTQLTVSSTGTINANGTSTNGIVFTSYTDDSAGGDSNGDGTLTTPLVGDWGMIVLNSSGSVFNYAKFYYGGAFKTTLQIGGNLNYSATVTNSTFAHNNGGDVVDSFGPIGVLDAAFATSATVITGNTFYANKVPLRISGLFSVDDSNTFHDPANAASINLYNGIFLIGHSAKPITGVITFSATEVPYVLSGSIEIPLGSTLTIGNNVAFKFFAGISQMWFTGTVVNSTGTGVVFTSLKDDTVKGDTNGDGPSVGAAGDWYGIHNAAGNWTTLPNEFFHLY
jgi:hypothetical protein